MTFIGHKQLFSFHLRCASARKHHWYLENPHHVLTSCSQFEVDVTTTYLDMYVCILNYGSCTPIMNIIYCILYIITVYVFCFDHSNSYSCWAKSPFLAGKTVFLVTSPHVRFLHSQSFVGQLSYSSKWYLMGKSTISMAIFNSFLYVYHFGYPLPCCGRPLVKSAKVSIKI